jgi:phage shock protein E
MRCLFLAAVLITATPLAAQSIGSPLIDYAGFKELTSGVQPYRLKRLITLDEFNKRAAKKDVLVLDARSAWAFEQGHIKGAVNLPLPDFTADALAEVIGRNPDREILIYCNNNFVNNRNPVRTKALPLALNIQTFINLYGYGYRNVWEMGEAVDMDAPDVHWVEAAAT